MDTGVGERRLGCLDESPLQDSNHHIPLVTAVRLTHRHTQARGKYSHATRCVSDPASGSRPWDESSCTRDEPTKRLEEKPARNGKEAAQEEGETQSQVVSPGLIPRGLRRPLGPWPRDLGFFPAPHIGQFPGGRIKESGTQSPRPLRPWAS